MNQQSLLSERKLRGRNRASLRLKYSTLLHGIYLPNLFDQHHPTFDLFGLLKNSMKYEWLRDCLFVNTRAGNGCMSAVRAHPFVYVLIDALGRTIYDTSPKG
jgi:hypothetical protein